MKPYEHKAQYYETDQMGIVHHSNYIRWFESARIDFMSQIGVSYRGMEEEGIISPVLSVSCEYKSMVHFDDEVLVTPKVKTYNGVKLSLCYTITDKVTGEVRTTGESSHCFLNKEGHPVSLKKAAPHFHMLFEECLK
ncbi:MAG: acyl-CoA thioesterase [Lachnospiraceae bacterium]|nr:acyl-CoA thioesterase [Lachnospiraceae bacterium]